MLINFASPSCNSSGFRKLQQLRRLLGLGRPKHAIGTGPVVGVYSRNLIGDCSFYFFRSINLFESEMKRVELSETFP